MIEDASITTRFTVHTLCGGQGIERLALHALGRSLASGMQCRRLSGHEFASNLDRAT